MKANNFNAHGNFVPLSHHKIPVIGIVISCKSNSSIGCSGSLWIAIHRGRK